MLAVTAGYRPRVCIVIQSLNYVPLVVFRVIIIIFPLRTRAGQTLLTLRQSSLSYIYMLLQGVAMYYCVHACVYKLYVPAKHVHTLYIHCTYSMSHKRLQECRGETSGLTNFCPNQVHVYMYVYVDTAGRCNVVQFYVQYTCMFCVS